MPFRKFPFISACAVVLLVQVLSCESTQARLTSSEIDLLEDVGSRYRRNLDALRTWKGEGQMNTVEKATGSTRKRDARFEFAYCAEWSAIRFNKTNLLHQQILPDGGQQDLNLGFNSSMFKEDALYTYLQIEPNVPAVVENQENAVIPDENGHYSTLVVIDEANEGRRMTRPQGEFYHPVEDTLMVRNKHVDDLVKRFMRVDAEPGVPTVRVQRSDNLVVCSLVFDTATGQIDYTFDLEKGGNLVKRENRSPERTVSDEIVLEEINGVFVPMKHLERQVNEAEGTDFFNEIVFSKQEVNLPLSPTEFSLAAMGVQPNDIVRDNRLGIEYAYDPERAIEVAAPLSEDPIEELLTVNAPLPTVAPDGILPATEPAAVPEPPKHKGENRDFTAIAWSAIASVLIASALVLLLRRKWNSRS